jgi:uncharacterized membrane protein required for colicin V production
LVVAVLLLLLSVHSYSHESWWSGSYFIPKFQILVVWLNKFLPKPVDNLEKNVITPEVTS